MPIIDQLKSVSPDTAEAFYQRFYLACKGGNYSPQNAADMLGQVRQLFRATEEPVLKSYCLLYCGAVVDNAQLDKNTLADLGQFLGDLLAGLADFRVKDGAGHYVHFLSHATYLAQSIHEAEGQIGWEPLLEAYLRADIAFVWNENIVLADCLLGMVAAKDIIGLLTQLESEGHEGAKASNRRVLWLAMKVLNERAPRHDGAVFSALVDELIGVVG